MTHLDIAIEPIHQEIAGRLGLALIDTDPERVGMALAEVAEAGLEAALAIVAVQTRNLVAALMMLQGLEDARASLQRTILDSKLAGDE